MSEGAQVLQLLAKLPGVLLPWYEQNKRDLPWRHDRQPYHIWLSEIMLQQTRVEAVRGYYSRFLEALPTVQQLAAADDELLHKLWEGLGYYSRVRNLKKAAGIIVSDYGGVFPTDYEKILALPGIGPYTAGAICSIAFDRPVAAVDGNVLRVLSRVLDEHTPIDTPSLRKDLASLLEQVYPPQAGAFTQALMELGATLCGPDRRPSCKECPCRTFCLGLAGGTAEALPVRTPKRPKRLEERTVLVLSCGGRYALCKRPDRGLLAGLWELPNVPGRLELDAALHEVEEIGLKPKEITRQVEREHVFTHIKWCMRGYYVEVAETSDLYSWQTPEEIAASAALPTAFRQFLADIF